jgi:aminoglycoside phosphotransferase (APT) family kinase protein
MMIPEEKQPAVARALREAFAATEIDDIRPMTDGLSTALVFRIVVRGAPYLLRVITRSDAISDPTHQLACMKPATDAGLAPRLWYASVEDRILITDFVNAKPVPPNMPQLMAEVIRRVHVLPKFPKRMKYLEAAEGFVQRFQAANLLPERRTSELLRGFEAAMKVYPRGDADHVASHTDLKPDNTLYDGSRIWLVDWEAAALNDRYIDLVAVANFFIEDDVQEQSFLRTYFGEPASDYERARFYLMKQIVHTFCAALVIPLAARAGVVITADAKAPDFADFHRRLVSKEITLAGGEALLQYGLAHLERALQDMRTERFVDSLATVAAAHATT